MSDQPGACPVCGADGEPAIGTIMPGDRCTDRTCPVVLFEPEED